MNGYIEHKFLRALIGLVSSPVEFEHSAETVKLVSITFQKTGVIHDSLNDLRKECWVVIVEDEKSDTEILGNDTKFSRSEILVLFVN